MKKVLNLCLLGRVGNGMFQYCHARAYAEKHGHELRMGDWIGRKIFDLPDYPPIQERYSEQISELSLKPEHADKSFEWNGYAQHQDCLIYTRKQVREWLKFKKDVQQRLDDCCIPVGGVVAHRRVGDFEGYGYAIPSIRSYHNTIEQLGIDPALLVFITEENPITCSGLRGDFSFLPDFYRMINASTLLRANSCFSWWAATIGRGAVYSPIIDGLGNGEHDVNFVLGNHPRLSHHSFCTELHLKE